MTTAQPLYKVISNGEILDDFTYATVKSNLQSLFKVPPEQIDRLLSSSRSIIKSDLDHDKARRYQKRLTDAGLQVEMVAQPASEPTAAVEKTTPPPQPTTEQGSSQPTAATGALADNTPRRLQVEFTGNGWEYFGIWIVNILLTIVTLGIYSAWATVRNKQYFYGHTQLDGASFQYLASPLTILKGRLIAGAVFLAYVFISEIYPVAGLVLLIPVLMAIPWMIVRGLQFNAINSAYRNVRFNFAGSYGEAAKVTYLWPFLNALALFLLTPLVIMKGDQFRANGSRLGLAPFQLRNTPGQYYACIGKGILLIVGFIAAAIVAASTLGQGMATVVGVVGYATVFAYFMAALKNLYVNGVRLGEHRFESDLKLGDMLWLYVSNAVLIVLTLGLFVPFAKVRMARYRASRTAMQANGSLDTFVGHEQQRASAFGQELGEAFDVGFSPV